MLYPLWRSIYGPGEEIASGGGEVKTPADAAERKRRPQSSIIMRRPIARLVAAFLRDEETSVPLKTAPPKPKDKARGHGAGDAITAAPPPAAPPPPPPPPPPVRLLRPLSGEPADAAADAIAAAPRLLQGCRHSAGRVAAAEPRAPTTTAMTAWQRAALVDLRQRVQARRAQQAAATAASAASRAAAASAATAPMPPSDRSCYDPELSSSCYDPELSTAAGRACARARRQLEREREREAREGAGAMAESLARATAAAARAWEGAEDAGRRGGQGAWLAAQLAHERAVAGRLAAEEAEEEALEEEAGRRRERWGASSSMPGEGDGGGGWSGEAWAETGGGRRQQLLQGADDEMREFDHRADALQSEIRALGEGLRKIQTAVLL